MRRRLMMLKKSGGGLPSGYTAVDYLQSTGTQYIDTGYKYGIDSDIEVKLGTYANGALFGAQDSDDIKYKFAVVISGYTFWVARNSSSANINVYGMQSPITLRNTGELFKATDSVGIEKSLTLDDAGYVGPELTIYLFARHTTAGATNMSKSQIYYCRFYENGELICDMRPCLDTDGVPCMYDLIRRQTLYNQGTGSFTWG